MLSVEHIQGMVNSTAAVPPNRWSHVAAVFTNSETRLYLNGEVVATAPGSEPGGETPFVIGNVGENNLTSFFRGQVRSVRISKGEHYSSNFKPGRVDANKSMVYFIDDSTKIRGDELLNADGHVIGQVQRF